jgi:nucleotide-binding universal stress UspA family protein
MFKRVIVTIDGSDFSWRALGPAATLANQCDAALEIFQVVTLPDDVGVAEHLIREQLSRSPVTPETMAQAHVRVHVMGDTVASTIAAHAEATEAGIVVMSSVGRGRSAAVIGSIAEELLRSLFGPVMVVGPESAIDQTSFAGELVVPVDGSETSESSLGLAAAWGITLHARPWVVSVIEESSPSGDIAESSYPARLARSLSEESHHDVEFEVLHGKQPDRAITDFAKSIGATLIVASTHGRTGLSRMTTGSVAMGIVRNAPCPVVLNRPPHLH